MCDGGGRGAIVWGWGLVLSTVPLLQAWKLQPPSLLAKQEKGQESVWWVGYLS